MDTVTKLEQVTRFEVVDHRESMGTPGRVLVAYGVEVLQLDQDEGRTLKIVLRDHPTITPADVRQDIAEGLAGML